ncbi:MAG: insulinase family protein [Verrucomicrobiales bacterium]|nr:insulinase family protein [Verrucomicrobiales bacterium]
MARSLIEFPRNTAGVRTLPNGLELIVREDHSSPVVSLQAWVRTGSIHEGEWLGAGLSHFLEHMLFKGTSRRSANEIAQSVQGAGGYVNAYTSFDRTVYWIDTPADGFETCLDVLCDVIADSQLPEEEFEKEAEVIRREFAMGDDNPDQVLSKLLFRTAFAENPCRHPIIGHLDLFNQLRRDDLAAYYHRQYSPDNVFLVIVGDVDADRVHDLVGGHLGHLSRRKRRHHEVIPAEPRQLGRRVVHQEFPTELSRTEIGWHIPDVSHPDMPVLDLLASIAGGGRSSRLYREVRERRGLAHSISTYAYTPAHAGLFILSVDTEPAHRDEAIGAALDGLRRLATDGPDDGELETAKHLSLSSQFRTLVTMNGQASDLGSNWILTRNLDFTRDYVEATQRVSRGDVTEALRRYLLDDAMTVVSINPPNATPQNKAPTASRRDLADGVRRVVLKNDLTLLLLRDDRVPLVTTYATFRGGMLSASPETAGINPLLCRLLTKDTHHRSSEEVSRLVESVGGSLNASSGRNTFHVSAGVMRPDLDLAIELVSDALLAPSLLEDTVEREKRFQIASIKAEDDRPFNVAMQALRQSVFGHDHPYGLRSLGSIDTVRSLHRGHLVDQLDRYVAGKNGVIAVFGDIDPEQAEDLVRRRFEGALPAGEQTFASGRTADSLPAVPLEPVELTHEKEQAVLLIGYRTAGLAHPERPALDLLDEACSDMASRVFIRIREELGLAYSVGATQLLGLDTGIFVFYVATAPDQLDRVQAELLDEIDLLRRDGLEAEEFRRAKSSFLGREIMGRQSAQQLAGQAAVDELLGLGWDHFRQTPAAISALDQAAIQAVAASHFTEDRRVIVRLTRG